jgi:hypothetical protein
MFFQKIFGGIISTTLIESLPLAGSHPGVRER